MKTNWIKSAFVFVALSYSLAAAADSGKANWGYYWGHDGAYVAELDLNPLGIPRIEAIALVLHRNGTANFISEHEPSDLSTSGVGVWERLGRNKIGIGLLVYRMSESGAPTVCANIMVSSPDNCVLKIGTAVTRISHGVYSGSMLLTIEGPAIPGEEKVVLQIPVELPFTMRRLDLAEFPGALQ